jgi:hypothetical protein
MNITRPNNNPQPEELELKELYEKNSAQVGEIDDEELDIEEEEILTYGLQELKKRRLIPLGKSIYTGKPFFMKYPPLTDTTYNVFTFVGSMGSSKSTNVRSLIYYSHKIDPDAITVIFDPMKMEYSKLAYKETDPEILPTKKSYLLNETLHDPETGKPIQIEIEPDNIPVFHLIPRFAIKRDTWNSDDENWEEGFDTTTLRILNKDGGFVWAEDASTLTEDQLFNALNYRELRGTQAVHYYLRQAIKLCNTKYGKKNWYISDMIGVLREGVKKYRSADEVESFDDTEVDKKTGLSSNELQLIEQLEKYNDAGFFIKNKTEKKRLAANFRKFIRIGKVLNISYMGFKKTEKIGEDLVVGQTDLILERLITISNEFYDALRKKEQKMPLSDWEEYLVRKWKVSLWFEESEIFTPRDCPSTDIKKWPCIKRLDYLMSFGRKFGFKNFGFITQRVKKVNGLIFEESNNIFIGPLIGEERDKILSDFGVNKLQFPVTDAQGNIQYDSKGKPVTRLIRDIVSTLRKEKHEWVYISKSMKSVAPIGTFDSPCG